MRHLDLFSGIGGFSLAAQWVWGKEHEIVAFCEIDKFCQKVLKKHWPNVPIIADIHNIKGDGFGTVDIITGGYPCQGESLAGKRRGDTDDRWKWPEMFRIIKKSKPTWVIGENVTGHVSLGLNTVLSDLESEGYTTRPFLIPACGVNAWHKRERCWIVAHSNDVRLQKRVNEFSPNKKKNGTKFQGNPFERVVDQIFYANPKCSWWEQFREIGRIGREWKQIQKNKNWEIPIESAIYRRDDGLSFRLDRLRSLGNAIVPQVAAVIMQAIKEVDELKNQPQKQLKNGC